MPWDLETGRVRIGLDAADVSRDADLTVVMGLTLELAEGFCNRRFLLATESGERVTPINRSIRLKRWPITAVTNVVVDEVTLDSHQFVVNATAGFIASPHFVGARAATVTYEGGYAELPVDLEWALWQTFDTVWAESFSDGTGRAAVTESVGQPKAVTLFDVGRIDLDLGTTALGSERAEGPASALLDKGERISTVLARYADEIGGV